MRHGSLFSGIGGFDLAAQWMGWENIFHCEWNPFGQRVLKYYWPNAKSYEDITQTDFTIYRGSIDILTGGFPCQPYSMAGKRKGKEDERHLWPEMLRAIREIGPSYIVGENVLGLVNWDGGLVFDEVQADLESAGYEVAAVVIPAAAKNAPHGRDRVWFVAQNAMHSRCVQREFSEEESGVWQQRNIGAGDTERICGTEMAGLTADTDNTRNTTLRCGIERNRTEESEERKYTQPQFDGHGVDGLTADSEQQGRKEWRQIDGWENSTQNKTRLHDRIERLGNDGDASNTRCTELQGSKFKRSIGEKRKIESHSRQSGRPIRTTWEEFPTQSPIRKRDDGVSNKLLKFVVDEYYHTASYTSQENRVKNLSEVRERIQSPEVWEAIRGLYSLERPEVLLQVVQLYSETDKRQEFLSPFGEELCKPLLQHLRKHGEFRRSPQGQELQKQRDIQFGNTLSFLPHEVALAARRFETAIAKFETWHAKESIKAYGNAIVPHVAFEIFKVIQIIEHQK